jgi:transcriptional regulator with XRE-family HTH domain
MDKKITEAQYGGEMSQKATNLDQMAARLRETRQAMKLTQARLCRIADIPQSTWNNAETGDNRLGLDQAIKLCDAFGLTLDWIYRGIASGLPTAIQEALVERRRRGINVNGR